MKTTLRATIVVSYFVFAALLSRCGGSPTVLSPAPSSLVITSGAPPAGSAGSEYGGSGGFSLAASGGISPYKWSWIAAANSSLPPGLALTGNVLSGTPTTAGSFSVVVMVTDSGSTPERQSATYPINIDTPPPPLEVTSGAPPAGAVGIGYGPVGTEYLSCVLTPVGGWHEACTPCDYSAGSCPSRSCSRLNGDPFKPCLETEQVALGFTFTATGGTMPYAWNSNGMPPGLTLDASSGQITGTPTTAGSYAVSVTVTDSDSPPAHESANYTIEIGGSS